MILVLFLTGGGGFLEALGQKSDKTHKASAANKKTYTLEELQGVSFSELWGEKHGAVSIGVLHDMAEIKTPLPVRSTC